MSQFIRGYLFPDRDLFITFKNAPMSNFFRAALIWEHSFPNNMKSCVIYTHSNLILFKQCNHWLSTWTIVVDTIASGECLDNQNGRSYAGPSLWRFKNPW